MNNHFQIMQAYFDEMEKLALPRQLKIVQKMLQEGDKSGAEALLAKLHASGTLKVTDQGSQLTRLGGGAEGVAHTTVGAKNLRVAPDKVTVRKTYDRGGALYSKQMLAEKMQAGRKLQGDDRFAQLLSKRVGKGTRGGRYMHYEHVPGVDLSAGATPKEIKKVTEMTQALSGRGGNRRLNDVLENAGNVIRTPSGKLKALDYLPSPESRMHQVAQASAPYQRYIQSAAGVGPRPVPPTLEPRPSGIRGLNPISAVRRRLSYTQQMRQHQSNLAQWQTNFNSGFNSLPRAQQARLGRYAASAPYNYAYPGVSVAPSDMKGGIRRANQRRALSGL